MALRPGTPPTSMGCKVSPPSPRRSIRPSPRMKSSPLPGRSSSRRAPAGAVLGQHYGAGFTSFVMPAPPHMLSSEAVPVVGYGAPTALAAQNRELRFQRIDEVVLGPGAGRLSP